MANQEEHKKFKKFDIIPNDLNYRNSIYDHNNSRYFHNLYLSNVSEGNQEPVLSPETIALIRKDWSRLEESLPDSIYVRAYEGRIDLLRAVFVGPSGTPYHGGLFFYDIQLTSDYPNSPPYVFSLLTKGLTLEPNNVHPDDMIWYSPKGDFKDFSILKVLLRIHEHLISKDSYINYQFTKTMQKNASNYFLLTHWGAWQEKKYLTYDQDMFILNCKTMLVVLDKQYKYFEEFIAQHFRDHAKSILAAAEGYIGDGQSNVAKDVDNADHCIQIDELTINEELEGYRKSMSNTYVKLMKAFIKNGSTNFTGISYYNSGNINMDDVDGTRDATRKVYLLMAVAVIVCVCVYFGLYKLSRAL